MFELSVSLLSATFSVDYQGCKELNYAQKRAHAYLTDFTSTQTSM